MTRNRATRSITQGARGWHIVFLLAAGLLGCDSESSDALMDNSTRVPPATLLSDAFSERFCDALTSAQEPCGQWLHNTPNKRRLGASNNSGTKVTTLIVSGLFSDCVARWFEAFGDASLALQAAGYDISILAIGGRASIKDNAAKIRLAIAARAVSTQPLIVIGYSKGGNDLLEALRDADTAGLVDAAVTIGGAVFGSELIAQLPSVLHKAIEQLPFPGCQRSDSDVLEHLSPRHRENYMQHWQPAAALPFYTVAGLPTNERVSRLLKPAHRALLNQGIPNDGQVSLAGATVPAAQVLAYVNADHWALALPIEDRVAKVIAPLVDQNTFPRAALLKAIIDTVADELAQLHPPEK